jgi:putative ABC transport system ATP-binding protein
MSQFVCELESVSKSYKSEPVISGLDLQVESGEMVAIVGRSGSGKSTLLNLIGLLEAPDGGRLRLFGAAAPRVKSAGAIGLLKRRLGYLFQNYALIDGETVDYNLAVAQQFAGGSRAQKVQRRSDVLGQLGLEHLSRKRVYALSGGEQQRVAIARLFLKPCDLILADEPTGSLDEQNRDTVLDLLHQMNRAGKSVIVVTHDRFVASSCDRTITLP